MPTLDWLNRKSAVTAAARVPCRILQNDPELGAGDPGAENLLIQGDNLDALKALLPFCAGRVKCIYIDPPYNTGSAFEHYDDNIEHSTWLSLMFPRLVLLRDLLAEDGSIWVSIDDTECHYLKVIMDEVFGRKNFVSTVTWQMRTSRENRRVFSNNHEYLLLYVKDPVRFAAVRHGLALTEDVRKRYKNPDNDPRGHWQSVSANAQAGHGTPSQFYTFTAPNGKTHELPKGRCWLYTQDRMQEEIRNNNVWFGKDGNGVPRIKRFMPTGDTSLTPETLWLAEEVGTNDFAKKALVSLLPDAPVFETPKPESLVERVLHIATNPGDLVLDSFLGSGTTAAVALKMGRRFIGIEMGEHAVTHCVPRLRKVIEGEQGGISEAAGWKGGGGFRFYRLGPTIFDETGAIRKDIKFPELAAYVWFCETRTPLQTATAGGGGAAAPSPLLGVYNGRAVYLLYNGILGDRRPQGGNVLTSRLLKELPAHTGPKTVYGECTRMSPETLRAEQIVFKQIPYDIRGG